MTEGRNDKRRENGLLAINADIMKLVKSFGKKEFSIVDIMLNWEGIVGEEKAKLLKPVALKAGKITLSAASSALAMEVSVDKVTILSKINAFFGSERVTDMKVIQDMFHEKSESHPLQESTSRKDMGIELDPAICDKIEDEELRKAVFSLAQAFDSDDNK